MANALKGLQPVSSLSLKSYAGKWYEQRRLDSGFEKDLDFVTAEYEARNDGFVSVTNSGVLPDRRRVESKGMARLTDVPGYLLVSFFPLVEGDYVILHLDASTSVVGSPDRKYLWLLTRDSVATEEQLQALKRTALANGYAQSQLDSMREVRQK
jgi:apolipoprotein D and lipocalin family protein